MRILFVSSQTGKTLMDGKRIISERKREGGRVRGVERERERMLDATYQK